MNRLLHIKLISLTLLNLIPAALLYAAPLKVDYYGVVSQSSDANMLKMAQDIFYTQLKSVDNITVNDLRPDATKASIEVPELKTTGKSTIAFYAEIEEDKSEDTGLTVWRCKFNALNPSDGITRTKNETYDSYYKILSSAKNDIEEILKNIDSPKKGPGNENLTSSAMTPVNVDIESLAGTWSGEPFTDKIIILRGGRGFVIFKNGATMNIKITVKN